MVAGMVSPAVLTLLVIPVIYMWLMERRLHIPPTRQGSGRKSLAMQWRCVHVVPNN